MISTTIKKMFLVLVISVLLTGIPWTESALLGESCKSNTDCSPKLSQCDVNSKTCSCKQYTIQSNVTTCLPGALLGFSCDVDAQCLSKVPNSGCVNHVCACGNGYISYRRHTCYRSAAKLNDVCFENEQCSLADKRSYCKFYIPNVYGRCQCEHGMNPQTRKCVSANIRIGDDCEQDEDCTMKNAYCHRQLDGNSQCTCDMAHTPSSDRARCLPTYRGLLSPASLGYPCHAHLQCQLSDPNSICNKEGVCDCVTSRNSGNSLMQCSAKNTGCHQHTFQCESDGKCISWFFVCDQRKDCADGSDESMCNFETTECPKQAFQCKNDSPYGNSTSSPSPESESESLSRQENDMKRRVKCISRSRVCDGTQDCGDGSDEFGCKGAETCPPGTFQCTSTKECLPEFQFCNAVKNCDDYSDESIKCRVEFQPSSFCPFRCDNGLCRSSAVLCSGIDGCGDNSDEKNCQVCRCPRSLPPSFKKHRQPQSLEF